MKKEIKFGENKFLLVKVPVTAMNFKNDLENGGVTYTHSNNYQAKIDTGLFNFGISRNILGKADQINNENILKYFKDASTLFELIEEHGFKMDEVLILKQL